MCWGIARHIHIFVIATCLKLLLLPAYRSTDFEVHRNWLAITHSLPLREWYFEKTSEWTLDYPPFFAWFEYGLSQVAALVDPKMIQIGSLNYASPETVLFQRMSVILTDFILFVAICYYVDSEEPRERVLEGKHKFNKTPQRKAAAQKQASEWKAAVLIGLTFLNPGLLLVDHVHFQYNGFMLGILLFSIAEMKNGRYLSAGVLYASLLMFKHMFLFAAPVFGIFLLRHYCFVPTNTGGSSFSLFRFVVLGAVTLGVFALALLPVLLAGPPTYTYEQMLKQLFSRLFPFQRGLCHAYWAPNLWALYNALDKALTIGCTKVLTPALLDRASAVLQSGLQKLPVVGPPLAMAAAASIAAAGAYRERVTTAVNAAGGASMTGGLVQTSGHSALPSIAPSATAILTFVAMIPVLLKIWFAPVATQRTRNAFPSAVCFAMLSAFVFGYHVHEKHILQVLVPLTLTAADTPLTAKFYLLLAAIGHYSLHPLLFTPAEQVLKVLVYTVHTLAAFVAISQIVNKEAPAEAKQKSGLFPMSHRLYIAGLLPLAVASSVLPFLCPKLPFLPLLLTSLYCACGVLWSWRLSYSQVAEAIRAN